MQVLGYAPLTLATVVVTVAAAGIALYIAYQAYRGLRRHDSRPMRYLSVGLFLLFGVTYVVSFAGTMLLRLGEVPLRYQPAFRFLVRVLQLGGLSAIAYSLYLARNARPSLRPTADGGIGPDDRSSTVPADATATDADATDTETADE